MTNPAPSEKSAYDLDGSIEADVHEALAADDSARLKELFQPLHHADAAGLLERLSPDERGAVIGALRDVFNPEILSELDDAVLDEVFDALGPEDMAAAVSELESDDAVEVVEDLDEEDRQQVLDAIPPVERSRIEEGLAYPEDSAGRLMQREVVCAPVHWTVGETIDFLRKSADAGDDSLPEVFYNIFVVDPAHRPLGALTLSRLLRSKRKAKVADLMIAEIKTVPADMDQEEVAFLFRQRDLVSAAVVDEAGRLIGAVTVDDVVDVIDEEHEEDIMLLGGVREDDLYEAALTTTRSRFAWLLVNLLTAILASVVIGMFEGTISQMVALAVLMPIVASMGGNAGTQTMTVAVRALAMKELTTTNAMRIIGKELMVGAANGIMFAVLTGVVAWLWFDSPALGAVIAMAMTVNMIVAGLAGTTIPLMLERNGVDPAVASSVILTTITDVVGFAVFLGLAAWLLL
ncbi:MAG TPA: magnesium transporter [Rhodospirillales bacterium]|nr:magnesium transporter [Rhodospirillales bacterium]